MSAREAELKQRLEGGHAVLQAAELRLNALVPALQSWRWEAKVRALADVARAFVRDEAPLRALVPRAARRVVSEAWPKGPTRSLVEHVGVQLAQLDEALTERGFPSLEALVLAVVGAPRKVALNERDAAAAEVLDAADPLVARLLALEDALSSCFGRPHERGGALPVSLEEYEALTPTWHDGRAALAEAWGRVARIDSTGGVERWLQRRAEVAPRAAHRAKVRPGPAALAGAAFWHRHATALRRQWLEEVFTPVLVREVEEDACFRFVLQRTSDGAARLGATAMERSADAIGPARLGVSAMQRSADAISTARHGASAMERSADGTSTAREALLMLAHELRGLVGRAPLQGGAAQVRAWAELADTQPSDDWRRLRDSLQVVMARTRGPTLSPLQRSLGAPVRVPAAQRLADFFRAP